MKLENYRAGEYIKMDGYKAFILSKINYNWSWEEPELNKLLAEASRKLGELNAHALLINNSDVFLKMFVYIEANKSSKIEEIDTEIEENILGLELAHKDRKQYIKEVQGCIDAIFYGIEGVKKGSFVGTKVLKEMHEILMKNSTINNNKPR